MNNEQPIHDLGIFVEFTPATLQQYIDLCLSRLVTDSLPEMAGMIRLQGRLIDAGRPSGKTNYGGKIADDGGTQIKVDIPTSLLSGRGIVAGHQVAASGRLTIRTTSYGVEIKMSVADIRLLADETPENTPAIAQGRMTLDRLKGLRLRRNEFPVQENIAVCVIQSTSLNAQVVNDCMAAMSEVLSSLKVHHVKINITDPVAISQAIHQCDADVLVLIRGGGDGSEFDLFDDPRIVEAMTEQCAYRIVGLGHSGNQTLLDVLSDFSASTPTHAGTHIRDRIMSVRRNVQDVRKELTMLKERSSALEKERNTAQEQAKSATALLKATSDRPTSLIPAWVAIGIGVMVGAATVIFLIR